MRYWQHGETGRLLAIDLQMAPSKWTEITKEQYEEAENERNKNLVVLLEVQKDEVLPKGR